MKSCAVILGDYINGYAIIKELYEEKVDSIVVLTYNPKLGYYSNKIADRISIAHDVNSLLEGLRGLKNKYDKLILFPTDDWYVEQLTFLENEIKDFCFIPFNTENSILLSNKVVQYEFCNKANVPYPKSISLEKESDLDEPINLQFPLIIKPVIRNDLSFNIFRSKIFEKVEDLLLFKSDYLKYLEDGIQFLLSEIIPGVSHGKIYAYSAYVSKEGEILNEWVGKKLSQFPDDFGVFSSASNEAPDIVMEQGRRLVIAMGITGFCEPEFKYDDRDGKYKLMEVNLRSMMWNEVGRLSGVKLHYTQWQYANQLKVPQYRQIRDKKVILFYFKHELLNLLFQKKYYSTFKNIWKYPNLNWAGIYKGDYLPIYKNFILTMKAIVKKVLK